MLLEPEVGGWTNGAEVERGGRPRLRETENSTEGWRDGAMPHLSLEWGASACPCSLSLALNKLQVSAESQMQGVMRELTEKTKGRRRQ